VAYWLLNDMKFIDLG